MKNKIFISIYKFDDEYLEFIAHKYKESNNIFVSLFTLLKSNTKKNLIKILMAYKNYDEVVIVFNDENYQLLEQLFYMLSLSIFKLNITEILPDKSIKSVALLTRIVSIFKMTRSSVEMRNYINTTKETLKNCSKNNVHKLTNESNIFYLKTNLSFGTKAGGSLGHISGVVNGLTKKSNITYISTETPIMINEEIEKEFIDLQDVVYSIPYELNSVKINEAFIDQVDKLIQNNKPDVIYQRLTLYNNSGAYLSNKYKIPLIVEYNGSEVWVQKNWGGGLKYAKFALEMEEYVLNSADTIITVSEVLQDELIKRGFDKGRIVFYPNCIDENIFDYKNFQEEDKKILRAKLGFKKDDKVFTFIGTFGAWHGVEFLAESIEKLVKNHKKELDKYNVKFLLIGDGLLGEKVRDALGNNGIQNYVKLTGIIPQQDAPRYLSVSDCFLSPHIKQKDKFIGSPTKLFEYMAFAKPIIASNLDQIGEVFENKIYANELDKFKSITNESAIVYEPDNYDEFIKSILFVSMSHDISKLGQNAYEMVMDRYTWDVHVDKIIEKYNNAR